MDMNDLNAITSAAEPPIVRKLHSVGRILGTPVAGTFELTAGCNFNCKMCYIHETNRKADADGELSAEQWLRIGRMAADAGTVFVLLTGGEPLARPDFAEIYTGLKKMGLMISVNTNGYLLTGELAELFIKNPPMRLNVSLYSDNREGYLDLCGKDAFDRVLANVRRLKDAGVEIKINASFCKYNGDRVNGIADLARELGLHCQSSFYMYPPVRKNNKAKNEARLAPADAAALRVRWEMLRGRDESLKNTAARVEMLREKECEDADLPSEGVRCRAGHTSYWISSEGQMLMCGMIPESAGSVIADGFDSCWQKTRDFMKTIVMPSKCTACALRPLCCVCPAACYAETGSFDTAPEYLCEMSEAIAREISRSGREEPAGETQ